eukprot:ANDGO_04090.mRNA.1 putative WD repeat-containing protein C343.04c
MHPSLPTSASSAAASSPASSSPSSSPTLDDRGPHEEKIAGEDQHRTAKIRLLQRALLDAGFDNVADLLQRESGVVVESKAALDLRKAVCGGNWQAVRSLFESLCMHHSQSQSQHHFSSESSNNKHKKSPQKYKVNAAKREITRARVMFHIDVCDFVDAVCDQKLDRAVDILQNGIATFCNAAHTATPRNSSDELRNLNNLSLSSGAADRHDRNGNRAGFPRDEALSSTNVGAIYGENYIDAVLQRPKDRDVYAQRASWLPEITALLMCSSRKEAEESTKGMPWYLSRSELMERIEDACGGSAFVRPHVLDRLLDASAANDRKESLYVDSSADRVQASLVPPVIRPEAAMPILPIAVLHTSHREIWCLCLNPTGTRLAIAGLSNDVMILDLEGYLGAVVRTASNALAMNGDHSHPHTHHSLRRDQQNNHGHTETRSDSQETHNQVSDAQRNDAESWSLSAASPNLGNGHAAYFENGRPITSSHEVTFKKILRGHTAYVCFLAWSPDGKYLLTCGHDHSIRLWDAATGWCLRVMGGHSGPVSSAAWFANSSHFLSCSVDGSICLWKLAFASNDECKKPDSKNSYVVDALFRWENVRSHDLCISKDSHWAYILDADSQIRILDLDLALRIAESCASIPSSVTLSTVSSSNSNFSNVLSYAVPAVNRAALTRSSAAPPHHARRTPWSLNQSTPSSHVHRTSGRGPPGVSPGDPRASVAPWRTRRQASNRVLGRNATARAGSRDAWNAVGPVYRTRIGSHANSTSMVQDAPSVPELLESRIVDALCDHPSETVMECIKLQWQPTSMVMDRKSKLIAISCATESAYRIGEILLFDTTTGHVQGKLEGHRQDRLVVRSAFAGADDRYLISGSEDDLIYVYSTQSGEILAKLSGHTASVNDVAYSPLMNGIIISCSDDGTLRLWGTSEFPLFTSNTQVLQGVMRDGQACISRFISSADASATPRHGKDSVEQLRDLAMHIFHSSSRYGDIPSIGGVRGNRHDEEHDDGDDDDDGDEEDDDEAMDVDEDIDDEDIDDDDELDEDEDEDDIEDVDEEEDDPDASQNVGYRFPEIDIEDADYDDGDAVRTPFAVERPPLEVPLFENPFSGVMRYTLPAFEPAPPPFFNLLMAQDPASETEEQYSSSSGED